MTLSTQCILGRRDKTTREITIIFPSNFPFFLLLFSFQFFCQFCQTLLVPSLFIQSSLLSFGFIAITTQILTISTKTLNNSCNTFTTNYIAQKQRSKCVNKPIYHRQDHPTDLFMLYVSEELLELFLELRVAWFL